MKGDLVTQSKHFRVYAVFMRILYFYSGNPKSNKQDFLGTQLITLENSHC